MAEKVKVYYVVEVRFTKDGRLSDKCGDWQDAAVGLQVEDFYEAVSLQDRFIGLANGTVQPTKAWDVLPKMLMASIKAAGETAEFRVAKYTVTREPVEVDYQVEKVGP